MNSASRPRLLSPARSRFRLVLAAIFFGTLGVSFALLRGIAHAAGADPVAAVNAGGDAMLDLVTKDGPWWAGLVAVMYGIRIVVDKEHWIHQGTLLTVLTGIGAVGTATLEWHFNGAPSVGILTAVMGALALLHKPAVSSATAPARNPQAGRASILAMIALALIGAAVAGSAMIGCTSAQRTDARGAAAAGVVNALNCEDGHLDAAVLDDAKALAADKLQAIISGIAPGDMATLQAKLKAELAPIKSDLGKCAVGGAFDALTTLAVAIAGGMSSGTATQGLSARAAASPPDPVQLRAAFSVAARQLGWSPIKVAGGAVL